MSDPFGDRDRIADYWRTSISDIAVSFPAMIWLMLRGELPSPAEARPRSTVSWRPAASTSRASATVPPGRPASRPTPRPFDEAARSGHVAGRHADAARAVEAVLRDRKGRLIPTNIDGATAVIYGELGFPPPLARGVFCLSRAVGILAQS